MGEIQERGSEPSLRIVPGCQPPPHATSSRAGLSLEGCPPSNAFLSPLEAQFLQEHSLQGLDQMPNERGPSKSTEYVLLGENRHKKKGVAKEPLKRHMKHISTDRVMLCELRKAPHISKIILGCMLQKPNHSGATQ